MAFLAFVNRILDQFSQLLIRHLVVAGRAGKLEIRCIRPATAVLLLAEKTLPGARPDTIKHVDNKNYHDF